MSQTDMKKKRIYIAGPMRGIKFYNFPCFDATRDLLNSRCWEAVSPADIDRAHGFDAMKLPENTDWSAIPEGCGSYEEIMTRDLDALQTCDAILLMDGWVNSEGAKREQKEAARLGLVQTSLDMDGFAPSPWQFAWSANTAYFDACAKTDSGIPMTKCQDLHRDGTQPYAGEVRVTDPTTGGQKGSKLARFDLIPSGPLWELAEQYGKGAKKYDDNNWMKGYSWKLSFAACMRHLWAFWRGEDIDPETGTKHVVSAAWHCFAMAWFMDNRKGHDDRPKA